MSLAEPTTTNSSDRQRVVCVFAPQRDAYSQTFIRAHKEYLPAKTTSLYTKDYETFADDDGPLVKPELANRLSRAILHRSLNLDPKYFQEQALRRFLRRNKVEAVLAEFGPTATLMMDVCSELRIPLIAHFHGFDAYRRTTLETFGRHYPKLFDIAAAIIAVSRDMQDQLVSLGAPACKLHYNSCGVDTSIFKGANPRDSPPTFIAVGRFVDKKAPHLSLLAFKQTLEKVPQARLVMIGNGPLWEACYQITRSFGLTNAVDLRGPCPQSEVADLMKSARVFIQHSVTTCNGDSEGTPVAILEAAASSLPVVSTRHAGIKDAVLDGKTGFLVNEGDVTGMAEHMTRLALCPDLAHDLGKAGREWIRSEYSMDGSINRLWSIIKSAINRPTLS